MENKNQEPKMEEIYPYKEGEQYVNLLQENITRMSNNSANCKNLLVAIIAGALAVTYTKESAISISSMLLLLKWVTGIFFFLDCLYLGIEREMIKAEKAFIKACKAKTPNNNNDDAKKYLMSFSKTIDIENKTPDECCIKIRQLKTQLMGAFCALFSWSTTPFYVVIFIALSQLN